VTAAPRRPKVVRFYALACLFAWTPWLLVAVGGGHVAPGSTTTHLPGLLGPMLAALLVSDDDERRRLLRSMLRWRVGRTGALIALGTPLVLVACSILGSTLAGIPPAPAQLFVYPGIPRWGAAPVLLVALIVNGLGEETGWRGYLLPALERRHSPLTATLILAPLWALWHWPMFLIHDTFRGFGALTLLGFFVGIAAGAIVLTFVYHRTRDSILMAALWHVGYNLSSATAAAKGIGAALTSALVIAWAVALVIRELRAARRGGSVLRPHS